MKALSIVLHDLRGGGAEKMMVRLANCLAQEGDDVELVLLTSGGENRRFVHPAVTVVELNAHRVLSAFAPLRRHLRQRRPDAVLAVLTHVNVIAALVCLSLGWWQRLTVSERNTFSQDRLCNRALVMRLTYLLAPWFYRMLPNPVVAVSRGVAQDLIEHTVVREDDVVVLPNPVITSELLHSAQGEPTHRWLRTKRERVVVAMGRLSAQKGFDLLLQAFAQVRAEVDCRLIIFGEGELRAALSQQSEGLGIAPWVDLPGYCEQPLAEISRADVFVLSSRFEGSPNSLVEAMAVGVPVVAFDCPHGPLEILGDSGCGTLVPPEDVGGLATAMIDWLTRTVGDVQRRALVACVSCYRDEVAAAGYRRALLQTAP